MIANSAQRRFPTTAGTAASSLLACVLVVAAAAFPAKAETWTNAAGHSIEAELKAVTGETVLLRTADRKELRISLKSLCDADRRRVLASTGKEAAPAVIQHDYQHVRSLLLRARQFHEGGKISSAEFARRRKHLLELFEKQCAQAVGRAGESALPATIREQLRKQLSEL